MIRNCSSRLLATKENTEMIQNLERERRLVEGF